jgi:hypothetical protein
MQHGHSRSDPRRPSHKDGEGSNFRMAESKSTVAGMRGWGGSRKEARTGRKCRLFAHLVLSPDSQLANPGSPIGESLRPRPRIVLQRLSVEICYDHDCRPTLAFCLGQFSRPDCTALEIGRLDCAQIVRNRHRNLTKPRANGLFQGTRAIKRRGCAVSSLPPIERRLSRRLIRSGQIYENQKHPNGERLD